MKANVNYNGNAYLGMELTHLDEYNVAFRIYKENENYTKYIEQLANDGKAQLSFFDAHTFVIVKRANVCDIIWL